MKWPVEIPYMRSAKQAMYVRELTWEYVKNNHGLSYEKMQHCIDRIDRLSKFISKRSCRKRLYLHVIALLLNREPIVFEANFKVIKRDYKLSARQVNFLIKTYRNSEKSKGTN